MGHWKSKPTVKILPGEWYATSRNEVISTLLGSCIAACLYDPESGIFGMNHFMLSNQRYSRDIHFTMSEAGRYGIHSMGMLINELIKLGANRKSLRAKVFGGASIISDTGVYGNFCCVGMVNCKFIVEFCKFEEIPLEVADLGGNTGRVIYFDGEDFAVYRRNIRQQRSKGLAERDHHMWRSSIGHICEQLVKRG